MILFVEASVKLTLAVSRVWGVGEAGLQVFRLCGNPGGVTLPVEAGVRLTLAGQLECLWWVMPA